jgi:paraquat-inducible protein B
MAENADRDDLPQATVAPGKHRRISAVWVIPILAAVVAIGIAVQRILSEGPTITITFKAAAGIEAGKTFIKYKDVNIGQVTSVKLSDNYTKVTVTAKIDKSAAGLMVEDAKFWVVEPRVTLSGVSGLGTLLSGNYIGFELGKSEQKRSAFVGLEVAPIVTGGQPGRKFVLKADKLGSLGVGAPIYYHSLRAGQVVGYDLASDGKAIDIEIFVNAPYEKYVTPATRFWNASGVNISLGAAGLEVRSESLAALLAGGVAFAVPPFASTSEPAAAGTVFTLFGDEATAMKQPESVSQRYVLYFDESLRGLSVGAPVTFLGLPGGEVTEVGLFLDPATHTLRGRVEIVTFAERLISRLAARQTAAGETIVQSAEQRRAFIKRMIEERGMRAQLKSGSLITGQLYVAFDFYPHAPKAKVDWSQKEPVLPVVPSPLPDLEAKVSSILAKLDKLPYEAIGVDTRKALASLDQTLKDVDKAVNRIDVDVTPELTKALGDLRHATATVDQLLKHTDATLASTDAPAQQELRIAMQEVARAAQSLRVLTDYLERHPEALLRGKSKETP